MAARERKGLGLAPFCIPVDKAIADNVTHAEMQAELSRLREAISLLAARLGNELGADDSRRILALLALPGER